jgi:dTDP-glucose 4,6-dehydratase
MKRKIAVIGSNSFSGGDFVDLLLDDPENEVIGLSRSVEKDDVFLAHLRRKDAAYRFYQFDLNQDISGIRELFDEFQPEYIVNFAAQSEVGPSWFSPWHWFETNTVALSRLVDYLKDVRYLKRYVHISSPEIYGSCEDLLTEEAPFNPSTPYAASKAAADLMLFAYRKNFDFPLVVIRSTNVYGPGQQLFKIIPRSVISLKSGKTIELHGGGKVIKSYIHIRDVSRGELFAMLQGRIGEVYHLSPDQGIAVRDVVQLVCDQMKVDFKDVVRPVEERLGQDQAYIIDSTKAREEFNWRPNISIEEGIAGVIRWVDDYWPRVRILPLEYIHKF